MRPYKRQREIALSSCRNKRSHLPSRGATAASASEAWRISWPLRRSEGEHLAGGLIDEAGGKCRRARFRGGRNHRREPDPPPGGGAV